MFAVLCDIVECRENRIQGRFNPIRRDTGPAYALGEKVLGKKPSS
jgi:hypothetical protein